MSEIAGFGATRSKTYICWLKAHQDSGSNPAVRGKPDNVQISPSLRVISVLDTVIPWSLCCSASMNLNTLKLNGGDDNLRLSCRREAFPVKVSCEAACRVSLRKWVRGGANCEIYHFHLQKSAHVDPLHVTDLL